MTHVILTMPWWFWLFNAAYTIYIIWWTLVKAQGRAFLFKVSMLLSSPMVFCWLLDVNISADKNFAEYEPLVMQTLIAVTTMMFVTMAIGGYQDRDQLVLQRKIAYELLKIKLLYLLLAVVLAFVIIFIKELWEKV